MYPRNSPIMKLNLMVPYDTTQYRHPVKINARNTRIDTNTFAKEMKYFWILMKIFLCHPVSFDSKTGIYKFSLCSLNTIYFCTVYAISLYCLVTNEITVSEGIALKRASMFESTVFNYMWNIFNCVLVVPALIFYEGSKMAKYSNGWVNLQAKFCSVTGRPVALKIKRMVRWYLAFTLGCLICTPIMLHMFAYYVFQIVTKDGQGLNLSPPMYIQQCIIFGFLTLTVCNWHILTSALRDIANEILACIKECVRGKVEMSEREMAKYEQLWLDLSCLVRETGTTFFFTITYILVIMFALNIIGFFMTMARLAVEMSLAAAGPIHMILPAFVSMLQIPWCAHNVTKTVGENFRISIQQLRLELTSKETRLAADRFVHTITINPPIIDLNGFVVLNKEFGTSMVGTMVTYLVVLIQFQLTFNTTTS